MTDDLNNLRPEVREDFESFDELVNDGYRRPMGFDKHWSALRAELLRLAKAEFDLRLALQDRLGVQDEYAVVAKGWQERAEKAEAELAEAQNTIAAQQGTMGALKRKLAMAEGELAALKARIAEAPVASVRVDDRMHVSIGARSNAVDFVPLHTKHVALVKVEG